VEAAVTAQLRKNERREISKYLVMPVFNSPLNHGQDNPAKGSGSHFYDGSMIFLEFRVG